MLASHPAYEGANMLQTAFMALTNADILGEWNRVDITPAERGQVREALVKAWEDLAWGLFLETVGD